MKTIEKKSITVEATISAPVEKVWALWSDPKHITQWCNASDDWNAPKADNDLRMGGKFLTTMAAKDGSVSFDFEGVYTNVQPQKLIEYALADGRKVKIVFVYDENATTITETFDAEEVNAIDMQRNGWQAILNNFKKYAEQNNKASLQP